MMKKKRLGLALSALMAGGLMVGNIEAVTLSGTGTGDAAMLQYYTVNNDWTTVFRIINTSDQAVAIKVRFRGPANTREVLDFSVFLSPYDMWIAWTNPDALKNGSNVPGIRTDDTSCLYPLPDTAVPEDGGWQTIDPDRPLYGAQFKASTFSGAYDDGAGFDPTIRQSEGHIEMIGIAQFDPKDPGLEGEFARAVTHRYDGRPADCQGAASIFESFYRYIDDGAGGLKEPGDDLQNILAFNAYLLNLEEGLGASYEPTVLAGFTNQSLVFETLQSDATPDLDSAYPTAGFDFIAPEYECQLPPVMQPAAPYVGPLAPCDAAGNRNNAYFDYIADISQGDFNPLTGRNEAFQSAYQLRWDGQLIGTLVAVSADLNSDGDTNDIVSIDLDGNGQCDGIETNISEANISLDVWSALGDGTVQLGAANNAATCDLQIVNIGNPITNITMKYGPGRFKQIGRMGVWPVTGGVDAISQGISASNVINEWAARYTPGKPVQEYFTQWVLTFPTKYYYVDIMDDPDPTDDYSPMLPEVSGDNDAWAPFSEEFDEGNNPGMSCEPFAMTMFNRDERSARFTSPAPVFPRPLCYEVNVLSFDDMFVSKGLQSNFSQAIPKDLFPTDPNGDPSIYGWANLQFTGPGTRVYEALGWLGLPVNGFMLTVYKTRDINKNHATITGHKYD